MKTMTMAVLVLTLTLCNAASGQERNTQFTLTAGEEPQPQPWTEPATFAFTSSDGKDSWSLNAIGKFRWWPDPKASTHSWFVDGKIDKNTLESKPVESFGASVGYDWELDTAEHRPSGPDLDAWYFAGSVSLGYADKEVFPDPGADCSALPLPAECGSQRETSVRLAATFVPFRPSWETTFYRDPQGLRAGDTWAYSFAPVLTVFLDQVVDAQAPVTGPEPEGWVHGAKLYLGGSAAPRFSGYRLNLRASYTHTQAFSRDATRANRFPTSSGLWKVSADYEFADSSYELGDGQVQWVPAIGISYTRGDDPLALKMDQDTWMLALKLKFRSK